MLHPWHPPTLGMLKYFVHILPLPLLEAHQDSVMIYYEDGKASGYGFLKSQLSATRIGCTPEKMQSLEINLCLNLRSKQSSLFRHSYCPKGNVLPYAIIILHCKICGEIPCGKYANRHNAVFMTYTWNIYTIFRDLLLDQDQLDVMLLVLRAWRGPGSFTFGRWFFLFGFGGVFRFLIKALV